MNNIELLHAMSDMLDEKLQPIKEDVRELKNDVQVLKEDVQGLKGDVQVLKGNVQVLQDNVQVLNDRTEELSNGLRVLQLQHENDILPRLCTIESCYVGTYERYRGSITQLDTMQTDIDVLKIVVGEHSEKLQQLA